MATTDDPPPCSAVADATMAKMTFSQSLELFAAMGDAPYRGWLAKATDGGKSRDRVAKMLAMRDALGGEEFRHLAEAEFASTSATAGDAPSGNEGIAGPGDTPVSAPPPPPSSSPSDSQRGDDMRDSRVNVATADTTPAIQPSRPFDGSAAGLPVVKAEDEAEEEVQVISAVTRTSAKRSSNQRHRHSAPTSQRSPSFARRHNTDDNSTATRKRRSARLLSQRGKRPQYRVFSFDDADDAESDEEEDWRDETQPATPWSFAERATIVEWLEGWDRGTLPRLASTQLAGLAERALCRRLNARSKDEIRAAIDKVRSLKTERSIYQWIHQ